MSRYFRSRSAQQLLELRFAAVAGVLSQSRTVTGLLDVSAAPEKAALVHAALDAEPLASSATGAVGRAVDWAFETFGEVPAPDFVTGVNSLLCGVESNDPHLWRRFEVPQFPYAPVPNIENLAQNLFGLLDDVGPEDASIARISRAAYSIWLIDLYGHFFADACGRTAQVVSAAVLATGGLRLPSWSGKSSLLDLAYDGDRLSLLGWLDGFRRRL